MKDSSLGAVGGDEECSQATKTHTCSIGNGSTPSNEIQDVLLDLALVPEIDSISGRSLSSRRSKPVLTRRGSLGHHLLFQRRAYRHGLTSFSGSQMGVAEDQRRAVGLQHSTPRFVIPTRDITCEVRISAHLVKYSEVLSLIQALHHVFPALEFVTTATL